MTTDALDSFVAALSRLGAGSESEARQQVFKPTCCPESLEIVPGVVFNKPTSFDYAPDIDVAHSKVKALNAMARAGQLAVINLTMEPGAGKTLHLPFRFEGSKSLVVLPALFDAWSAHLASQRPSNIITFSYNSGNTGSVTYTDSYFAAFLLSTGKISSYDIVFVDESHSSEGVTHFMASACVRGLTFVRMTATPQSVNTKPRRAFPIMEEFAAPELSNVEAVAEFVVSRPESRKLVMTPSTESASMISSRIPSSVLLTPQSPFGTLHSIMTSQISASTIVTDSTCSKSVNLNLDFVLDFGKVATPTGVREVTIPEQQQRKYRAGRNRPGVYCCPVKARNEEYDDQYSTFRNNLWCIVNSIPTAPCEFPDVSPARAMKLIMSFIEPALVPVESEPSKASSDSTFDDARASMSSDECKPQVYGFDVLEPSECSDPPHWQDSDCPSWLVYYLSPGNHAAKYLGDLIHDHRRVSSASVFVGGDLYLSQATNKLSVEYRPQSSESSSSSERRHYTDVKTDKPMTIRRYSAAGSSKHRPRSDKLDRKYSSALSKDYTDRTPMSMLRRTRTVGNSMGTAYKALSISGDYLVECGAILASSPKVETSLSPLPQSAGRAVNSGNTVRDVFKATHFLTWTVVRELSEVDLALAKAEASTAGAWSPPPVNSVPKIDLQTEYHSMWKDVLTSRVRDKLVLPVMIPRSGWSRRATRVREQANPMDVALDICDDPTYTATELQSVYKAWNVLAVRSASVAPCSQSVYSDAAILLTYMVSADSLADL